MSMTSARISDKFLSTLGACMREPKARSALVVVAFLGLVGGGVNLLVPLGLHAEDLSSGEIGLVFSASAGIFVVVSAVTARRHFRASNLILASVAAALYGVLMVVPIASLAAISLIIFVLARAPLWAVCATLAYPIGDEGARAAGIGRGAVFGLANAAWGIAAVVGPLITAWIAQHASATPAFAVLAVASLTAAWLLRSAARDRVPARDLSLEES
jgi:MFS family permease